jgi:integrase
MTLDEIFAARIPLRLFRFSTGEQPYELNKVFARLMKDADMLADANGEHRTLYSLRHTYATMELHAGTDIHTLARQMGTSVLMLEMFYSKVNATLSAKKLA